MNWLSELSPPSSVNFRLNCFFKKQFKRKLTDDNGRTFFSVRLSDFFRAMLYISAAYAVMRCLSVYVSVCLSATFVSCVKTNKHIIKKFSLSGSHAILVFRAKRHNNIPTGIPLTGASNASVVDRNRDSKPISGLTACVNAATRQVSK